jgi:CheY-like chemotaxis protein
VEAALQLAAAERFDVVVSDLGLPDGTGYDLMRQLRDRHGIKGIALSGYGMDQDQRRSREAGFLDHVIKPVDVSQLEAVIRRIVSGQTGG